jgi:hypothetical protein
MWTVPRTPSRRDSISLNQVKGMRDSSLRERVSIDEISLSQSPLSSLTLSIFVLAFTAEIIPATSLSAPIHSSPTMMTSMHRSVRPGARASYSSISTHPIPISDRHFLSPVIVQANPFLPSHNIIISPIVFVTNSTTLLNDAKRSSCVPSFGGSLSLVDESENKRRRKRERRVYLSTIDRGPPRKLTRAPEIFHRTMMWTFLR